MAPPLEAPVSANGQAAATAEQQPDLSHEQRNMRTYVVEVIDPLHKQLDAKLHELDTTLRPRLTESVKQQPLLAVAVAAGVGVLIGAITVLGALAAGHSRAD